MLIPKQGWNREFILFQDISRCHSFLLNRFHSLMFSETIKSSILAFSILSIIGFAVYANSLDVPFYLDDFRNITENRHVRIDTISFATLYDAAFKSPLVTRPVANSSFALNYFFHQDDVFGYHLVNIAIHVVTSFFLYLFFSATLSSPALCARYRNVHLLPLFASLLWLVHPLHTSSVTYVVQRMVLLAVMFYMLALLCYVKGRVAGLGKHRLGWFTCSLLSAVLAMGSKEIAVTLPFFIFLYEWYFFQDLDRKWLYKKLWVVGVFLVTVAIIYAFYAGSFSSILASYVNRPFTLLERVYTELRIVLYYIGLLLYPNPSRLNLDHYVSVSSSLFNPVTTVLSGMGIILALVLSVIVAKKQRLVSFAILWYLGNLVIESSFFGLELIFEHRTYLPSVLVIFALTVLVTEYVRPKQLAIASLLGILALYSYWTIERNTMWRDPVLFWADSVTKSPQKARPYMNLSVALRERGNIDEAIIASQKAITKDPRFINAYVGLGAAYVEKGELERAETQYLKALQMMPDYAEVYNALGVLYLNQGKVKEAVNAFNENLRLDPGDINALVNRASIMAYQGAFVEAIADFQKALDSGGRNADILFNLAVAYARNGEGDKAILALEEVLLLNPGDKQALRNLEQFRLRQQN